MKYTNMDNLLYINIYELNDFVFYLRIEFDREVISISNICCHTQKYSPLLNKIYMNNLWLDNICSVFDYILYIAQGCLRRNGDMFAFHMRRRKRYVCNELKAHDGHEHGHGNLHWRSVYVTCLRTIQFQNSKNNTFCHFIPEMVTKNELKFIKLYENRCESCE